MYKIEDIKGVMLGHAVADALGVPVEFCDRELLKRKPVKDMMGFGTHKVPKGTWSDDTSMSLAALDSLSSGRINYEEIMKNLVNWYIHGDYTADGEVFDVGRTCGAAIENFMSGLYNKATDCGLSDVGSNGNGSLMRIHPFVLMAYFKNLQLSEWEALIENGSALTHAHERSKLGCKIYALILLYLLKDKKGKSSVRKALDDVAIFYGDNAELRHYGRLSEKGFSELSEDKISSCGYIADTLEAAVWCLFTTSDYKECVLKAVNLGKDTDTVAAVAGGLAGAMYGYEAIPAKWLNVLIKKDYIEKMCEKAFAEWTK